MLVCRQENVQIQENNEHEYSLSLSTNDILYTFTAHKEEILPTENELR